MSYTKNEGFFKSSDGKNEIAYTVFTPDCTPKGIIQIAHGMMESISKYETDGFVEKMCSLGYVICGNDHIGHGKTAKVEKDNGYFTDYRVLVDDVHLMYMKIRETYRHLPVILFGHSMGSFIARIYITKYDDCDGCIIDGTAGKNGKIGLGIFYASLLALIFGGRHISESITVMSFASYYEKFDRSISNYVWQTSDREVQKRMESKRFSFTVTAYREMFRMIKIINGEEWYSKVPLSLPILLVSGENDPVGNYGSGIKEIYSGLENAEITNLTMKLIKDGRHEPYNDFMKDEYYSFVGEWCDNTVNGSVEMRTGI